MILAPSLQSSTRTVDGNTRSVDVHWTYSPCRWGTLVLAVGAHTVMVAAQATAVRARECNMVCPAAEQHTWHGCLHADNDA